jgi:DNA topoisomerase-1
VLARGLHCFAMTIAWQDRFQLEWKTLMVSRAPTPAAHNGYVARKAGLRYGDDTSPGIHRQRKGKSFAFVDQHGKRVTKPRTLDRIRALAIPPAWQDVWISPHANGHLQATGRDDRGRKQYRYHDRWTEARDADKYDKLVAFAKVLPRIRRRVARDLRHRGLPREKVLAAIVRLLETSLVRVGNEEYARTNGSFGLTTMKNRHLKVRGKTLRFQFRGKSSVEHDLELESPLIAKIARQCQDLPGQELFQYVDEGDQVVDVNSTDVNDYLREISGLDVTAKDFRTWAGTTLAAQALQEFQDFDSDAAANRNVTQAIERVATRLGNTKTVCRKCYVHPAVIDAYLDRSLLKLLKGRTEQELKTGLTKLSPEEAAVLGLLQGRLKKQLSRHTRPRRHK